MFNPLDWIASWALKKGLDKLYSGIVGWFTAKDQRPVLILGPGGVGKTTLGHFLAGSDITASGYEESISTEQFQLSQHAKVQVLIPPGQSHRRAATWDQLLERLRAGEFRGVIFAAAYGHHALGDISVTNHRLYDAKKGLASFLPEYLSECRKEEAKIIELICNALDRCDQPVWLLTLVTKQDLWWDDRADVEKHYSSGPYGSLIEKCLGRKSAAKFRHETAYVSLVIRNLVSGRGELLKKTTAGYDEPAQRDSFERLLKVLAGLMEWEKTNGS